MHNVFTYLRKISFLKSYFADSGLKKNLINMYSGNGVGLQLANMAILIVIMINYITVCPLSEHIVDIVSTKDC